MKKWSIRALTLALSLVLALGMAACGSQPAETGEPTPTAAVAEVDPDAVAVEIGEDFNVTYGEIEEYYNYYVQMMSYYGMAAPTADADIESMQDQAVQALVSMKKQLYFAKQLGLDELTAEEAAEVQAMTDEEMESYMQSFRESAEAEGAEDVEARAKELFNEDLAAYGIEMDYIEYAAFAYESYAQEKVLEKLQSHIEDTATVSEEDVQAYYDQLLESQTAAYGEDPGDYLTTQENFELNGGDPSVLVPEGYLRVKVITVEPQEAIDETYGDKLEEMAGYEATYGKLMLEDPAAHADTLKEIKTLYDALRIETNRMYETYMADATAKINEAKAKLDGGESFDAVLAAYGEDATYTDYALIAERGRLMMLEGDDGWDETLRAAALALEDGAYSDVLLIDDVYYIVYRVGSEPAGTRTLEELHDAIRNAALEAARIDVWNAQLDTWDADDSMVTYHEEVYRSIGK
ncbi:MAG: peptidyl-prolyl cis-trans isomerase [bacterium]|nr:peptidyl-prolyl cis-trans isomerase [bacterium]